VASPFFSGLVFVTRGGLYWFNVFDYFTCVVAMFFVTGMECYGIMWADRTMYDKFDAMVEENTGVKLSPYYRLSWKYTCPCFVTVLFALALKQWDILGQKISVPYPEGSGYYPPWSLPLGWTLGLAPLVGFLAVYVHEFLKEDKGTSFESVTSESAQPGAQGAAAQY